MMIICWFKDSECLVLLAERFLLYLKSLVVNENMTLKDILSVLVTLLEAELFCGYMFRGVSSTNRLQGPTQASCARIR